MAPRNNKRHLQQPASRATLGLLFGSASFGHGIPSAWQCQEDRIDTRIAAGRPLSPLLGISSPLLRGDNLLTLETF